MEKYSRAPDFYDTMTTLRILLLGAKCDCNKPIRVLLRKNRLSNALEMIICLKQDKPAGGIWYPLRPAG